MKYTTIIFLSFILFCSFALRFYGINWDSGFHLHPDERAIILFSQPLAFPHSLSEFFSPASALNPHFFAYGSFPLYLLKGVSSIASFWFPILGMYDGMSIVGRSISLIADLVTIVFIFLLGKRLFTNSIGLLGGLLYGLSTLAVQTAHFYVVDPLLTAFIMMCLYALIRFYEKPSVKNAGAAGILFGLSLATKTSAVALITSIGFTIIADIFLLALKHKRLLHLHVIEIKKLLRKYLPLGIFLLSLSGLTFVIFEPYAFIDFPDFFSQSLQQYAMTKDAFTFPYTLQYVDKVPYLYELKNMLFWGQGPILFAFSFVGLFFLLFHLYKKQKNEKWPEEILLILFFAAYFLIVGKFAVGFMRYMLPVYPILALFAAVGIEKILTTITNTEKMTGIKLGILLYILFVIAYWPVAFLHIYASPNTRIQATTWIQQHIPPGSRIAVEHWDDSLPLTGQERYTMLTLPLYDPDTQDKWEKINQQLSQTDYLIIASNRLYVPLQKLADCNKHSFPHCYPLTAAYYKKLFNGALGFKKIAEFSEYPVIPFLNISINDQGADESFTVYDHPRILIFQKIP